MKGKIQSGKPNKKRMKWTSPVKPAKCSSAGFERFEKRPEHGPEKGKKRKLDSQAQEGQGSNAGKSQNPRSSRTKKIPLIDEFNEIIASAQAQTSTAEPQQSKVLSPRKQLRIQLEDIATPARPNLNKSLDSAPSPVTPPVPQRVRMKMKEDDIVPSPQGMNFIQSTQSITNSQHNITQTVLIKQEPSEEVEESPFFNASDSSINESGRGLDLDVLIEEIFVENMSNIDVEKNKQGQVSSIPRTENLDLTEDKVNTAAEEMESSEKTASQPSSMDTPTGCHGGHFPPVSFPHQSELGAAIDSEKASCANEDGLTQNSPLNSQTENSGVKDEFCIEPAVPTATHDHTVASEEKKIEEKSSETNLEQPVPISAPVISNFHDADFLEEEAFCEDLTLSHSQFLAIDEKCSLSKDTPKNRADDFSQSSQKTKPQSDSQKLCMQPPTNPPVNMGFSVPPVPSLDWVKKTQESCQRLRMVTQEISRLNAMVLRARRTLWPRLLPQPISTQPHLAEPVINQNSRLHQGPFQSIGLPDMLQEPDWNIS